MQNIGDVVEDAISRTFSRSSIDGPFHDAEKDIMELDDKIEVILNRIALSAEDMNDSEVVDVMRLLTTSLNTFTNRVCELRKYRSYDNNEQRG